MLIDDDDYPPANCVGNAAKTITNIVSTLIHIPSFAIPHTASLSLALLNPPIWHERTLRKINDDIRPALAEITSDDANNGVLPRCRCMRTKQNERDINMSNCRYI